MAAEHPVDRAAIATDLERARTEFDRLRAESGRHDAWDKPTRDTRWTNEQLLFHMVFGYMIVQRLVILVRLFGRLPDQVSRVFAGLLNAATRPFDIINYHGSSAAALVYNRGRMGAKMDRVIAALQRKLAREPEAALHRGMHFPTHWDPFFTDYMTLEDVYRYPGQHFDFHKDQLTLDSTSANPSRALDAGGLSPQTAARVYDRIGRLQDTQSPFERPAVDRLIALGHFDTATSVFELGCGTGALAHRLLSDHLPPQSTYLGVDVSSRMITLASRRIATFAGRAKVVHVDGRLPMPGADHSADRFVAAYVFDLLPYDYAAQLIDEAHRLLIPGGVACLVSLTTGQSIPARLISRSWHEIWRRAPRLVGGCRPIQVRGFLDGPGWDIDDDVVIESWGVPSQLVVATAR